ncbi:MAG: 2Fe-2S iron-sulfur cluster-binding protein [Planctomycetota bacterium]|nr:2Fe-2S iron-sulfur cluster-binding protein [Planctomycetota bacterium]
MGGINPYIDEVEAKLPTRKYTVTFMPGGEKVEIDPQKLPYQRDGKPGSILDIALGNGIDVDHACGGVCACSTCHVIVREGADSCNEAIEEEEDQLDNAPGLEMNSRLGCQCIPDGTVDVVIEVPEWNRNLVQEEHG